jgi:serine/threonine protein kinase/tetratricopeptide (TPR) repeat protein
MAIQAPSSGQVLGHYRLIEQIGAGGMGVVFRARDEQLQRDVAIKILPAGLFADDNTRKQFRTEALAVGRLNHPNIGMAFDFGEEGGIYYLVTEYIPGLNLDEMLAHRALPQKTIFELGIQLASGLEAAHRENVIHRDLKPGNLRVNPDGQLKILDFGLAKLIEPIDERASTANLNTSISLSGTLPYMAPEVLRAETADARSDIWAAGTVLYEMATGKRAFPDRQPSLLIDAILHYDPVRPCLLNAQLSEGVEAVIIKALDRDPKLRYQSARELRVDLERLATGSGRASIQLVRPDGSRPRHRRTLWIAAAALSLVFAGFGWLYLRYRPRQAGPTSKISVLVTDFQNRTADPVFDQTPRELISTALGESHQVLIFASSRLPEVLKRMQKPPTVTIDENIGTEICAREDLQSVVSGTISRLGSSYLVLVRVLNCSGELIASTEKEFSRPEQLPAMIDEIAPVIRRELGESKAAIRQSSQPLALVTSQSLEAVKLYSLGKRQLYLGDVRGAVSFFNNAVELDDDFAMAHEYLGAAYEHFHDKTRAEKEFSRAVQLSGRVTEREREKTFGDYSEFKGNFDTAISHYLVLATLAQQDPSVHVNLAECYRGQFRFDLAKDEAKKAVDLEPAPGLKAMLAIYYYLSGDSRRAMDLAQEALPEYPDNLLAIYLIGSYYLAAGNPSDADRFWRQLLLVGDASRARSAMADAALVRDDPKEAIIQLQSGLIADASLQNSYEFLRKKILLGDIYWASGDYQSLERSVQDLPQPDAPELIFLLGRLYARAGWMGDAQKQLLRLEQLPDKPPTVESLSNMLHAEIAAAEGRHADAVQWAKRGVQHLNSPLAIETLARSYELEGDSKNAAQQYGILLARSNERQVDSIDSPALRAVVKAHHRLGVLYQTLGKNDLAKAQFNSFLNHADGAQHTGPMYEDARRRLNELSAKIAGGADQPLPHKESPH